MSGQNERTPGTKPDPASDAGSRALRAGVPFWKRPKARIGFLCAGVFFIGACLGTFVTSKLFHHLVHKGIRDPEAMADRMLDHMKSDLELTDEQAAAIRPVLVAAHTSLRAAVAREYDTMHRAVEQHLDDRQIAVHRRIVAERRARYLGKSAAAGEKGQTPRE